MVSYLNMDVIIPLGGKGERFTRKGYSVPKPLIRVGNKEMIRHVIDRLQLGEHDTISIFYHKELDKYDFSGFIQQYYPHIDLVSIPYQTKGAIETIDYGLKIQNETNHQYKNRKCLLLDCDAFYTTDIVGAAKTFLKNGVFVFQENDFSQPAKFSYVSLNNEKKIVIDIAEKMRISSFANTGAYCFQDRSTLYSYTQKVLEQDFRFNNEFYTSCAIKLMLMDGFQFNSIELPKKCYISLGTPEQMNHFLSNTHSFLFDLDGTLIDTTSVYISVWKTMLETYNIHVDYSFFKTFIDGNTDETVFRTLLPTLDKEQKKALSQQKDVLFLKFIHQTHIIEGAISFIQKVHEQGSPIGIVTNCNRPVAEAILHQCKLESWIDVLVIGNECSRPKPFPDPYQNAKDMLGHANAIVFEDSYTGFTSAKGISPLCIVGINCHRQPEHVLKQYGADIIVNHFKDLTISEILNHDNNNEIFLLEENIKNSISERFTDLDKVIVLKDKIKGGYIADVMRVDLIMRDGQKIECVVKLQSKNTDNLADMAVKLELYNREIYFYEVIRDHVRIKAPKYFGTIRHQMKPCGILLEYLPSPDYQLGIVLEKQPLDLTLNLVRKLASHHAHFWRKDLTYSFPQLLKNNDPIFCPSWCMYVCAKWPLFKEKWSITLNTDQLQIGESIVAYFDKIQDHLSKEPLTLCHGDVKSPNIFFRQQEPYFIDWQYIGAGKGVQDLVFLMIESFSISSISAIGDILKEYYYFSLVEAGVSGYSKETYDIDFQVATCYFPFYVAMWFGTTPADQVADVNFPFFFIQKLFSFMVKYLDTNTLKNLFHP